MLQKFLKPLLYLVVCGLIVVTVAVAIGFAIKSPLNTHLQTELESIRPHTYDLSARIDKFNSLFKSSKPAYQNYVQVFSHASRTLSLYTKSRNNAQMIYLEPGDPSGPTSSCRYASSKFLGEKDKTAAIPIERSNLPEFLSLLDKQSEQYLMLKQLINQSSLGHKYTPPLDIIDRYKRALARSEKTPSDVLELLLDDKDKYIRRAAFKNKALPKSVLEKHIKNNNENALLVMAGTKNKELQLKLFNSKFFNVHEELAENEHLDVSILEKLVEIYTDAEKYKTQVNLSTSGYRPTGGSSLYARARILRRVAIHKKATTKLLNAIADRAEDSKYLAVFRSIASNSNASPELLKKLYAKNDVNITMAMLQNPNTPGFIITKAHSIVYDLRKKDKLTRYSYRKRMSHIAMNPNTNVKILAKILAAKDKSVLEDLAKNVNLNDALVMRLLTMDNIDLHRTLSANPALSTKHLQALYSKYTSDKYLLHLLNEYKKTGPRSYYLSRFARGLKTKSEDILVRISGHKNISNKLVAELMKRKNTKLNAALAGNKKLSSATLQKLAVQASKFVVHQNLLQNPNASLETLKFLVNQKYGNDKWLNEELKFNRYGVKISEIPDIGRWYRFSAETQRSFLKYYVILLAGKHASASAELKQQSSTALANMTDVLIKSSSAYARKYAAGKLKLTLAQEASLADDKVSSVKAELTENPHIRPQTLEKLSHDKDAYIRRLVAGNSKSMLSTLQRLSADSDEKVRTAALTNSHNTSHKAKKEVPSFTLSGKCGELLFINRKTTKIKTIQWLDVPLSARSSYYWRRRSKKQVVFNLAYDRGVVSAKKASDITKGASVLPVASSSAVKSFTAQLEGDSLLVKKSQTPLTLKQQIVNLFVPGITAFIGTHDAKSRYGRVILDVPSYTRAWLGERVYLGWVLVGSVVFVYLIIFSVLYYFRLRKRQKLFAAKSAEYGLREERNAQLGQLLFDSLGTSLDALVERISDRYSKEQLTRFKSTIQKIVELDGKGLELLEEPESCDLNQFLSEYTEALSAEGKFKNLHFSEGFLTHAVSISKPDLTIVVNELLENADDFRRYGTSIILATDESDENVLLSIYNQGDPIADDQLDKIFEPGYKQRDAVEITHIGLGLFLSQEKVRRMGATLQCVPEAGGNRFVIHFKKDQRLPD